MRAVVVERPNLIHLRKFDQPRIGPDDVLIESRVVGVCRTDVNIFRGEVPLSLVEYPCILGHEWSGVVAQLGKNVRDLSLGTPVIAEGRIPCQQCAACRAGETNLCSAQQQFGFNRPGGYAEFVAAPRTVVHRLGGRLSLEAAVLVEPASSVLRALQRVAPAPWDTIGVIGIGTLGSIALRLARLWTSRPILAYGIRREELEIATELGADRAVNVADLDPEDETLRLTERGLDVVVETAGSPFAIELATRLVRPGGRVALLGIAGESSTLQIPTDRLTRKDIVVAGTLSYTSATWSKALHLAESGLLDLQSLVTHRFPLADFRKAIDLMEQPRGGVIKIVLQHQSPKDEGRRLPVSGSS
jgi:2-desacetyl-2-hydroxyethyl bacteriochlorophyllide A dehydrogenase